MARQGAGKELAKVVAVQENQIAHLKAQVKAYELLLVVYCDLVVDRIDPQTGEVISHLSVLNGLLPEI